MATESINIPLEEYNLLKKKAEIADDLQLQLDSSVRDLKNNRVKKV